MLRYKIIKQRNPLDENKKEMYYPRLTGRQVYNLDNVASYITDRSSLSKADIVATLVALEEAVPHLLKNGYSVSLGSLGTFSLQARVQTSTEREKVSWRDFLTLKVRFRIGKGLKLDKSNVHFKQVGK